MGQVNPMQLVQMIRQGKNPQQLMLSVLQTRAQNNPMMQNLLSLAQSGNTQGIQQVARNLARERGIDYDKSFSEFKSLMGL